MKKRVDRPVTKTISLPTSTVTKVEFELYSDVEGRVPYGAFTELVGGLLEEWLDQRAALAGNHSSYHKEGAEDV